ncbi:Cuticlin-1 [Aphelenchoides bicaudatus]|nr:Cuticlin-1 [Aphelenchoides bicaudatus]
MRRLLWVFAVFLYSQNAYGIEDNGILGDPYVNCGGDFIEVRFDTRNTFKGSIFVKDQLEWPECRSSPIDSNGFSARNASIRLNFKDCNLERRRSVSLNKLPKSAKYFICKP